MKINMRQLVTSIKKLIDSVRNTCVNIIEAAHINNFQLNGISD